METKLNPNQIGGNIGGSLVGGLYIDDLRESSQEDLTKWVEISPNNPTAVKCNTNAEYVVEFRKPFSNDGTLFYIDKVVNLHFSTDGNWRLESYNWGSEQSDVVMNTGQPAAGIPSLDDYSNQDTIRLKCVVNGTTKTWYYDVGGVWTALTHDEDGTAVASSYTDTGIDTTSTGQNMLLNNPWNDNPCTCNFAFSGFKITNNGQTVFDGSKAVKGVDYQTYRKDNGNTVPAIIKLTHYL